MQQIAGGSDFISGVMIESHLVEGRQDLIEGKGLEALVYGQVLQTAALAGKIVKKRYSHLLKRLKSAEILQIIFS